jgi:hypothetical protein
MAADLQALVQKWRHDANEPAGTDKTDYDFALEECADELEAALRAEAGAVGSAEIEAGAEAAWSMTPRGVPWGDASDHIQNEWRRIAKTILTAALAQARRTDREGA